MQIREKGEIPLHWVSVFLLDSECQFLIVVVIFRSFYLQTVLLQTRTQWICEGVEENEDIVAYHKQFSVIARIGTNFVLTTPKYSASANHF